MERVQKAINDLLENKEKIIESEDDRKLRIFLENMENYGSERSQQEILNQNTK